MPNVITIDGPTSSGKSSVGLLFAKRINYQFVDTGAIYRAGSLSILNRGISLEDKSKIVEVFKDLDISFKTLEGEQEIFLDGLDVTSDLHAPQVTAIVPVIAALAKVREIAKQLQRKIGSLENTVMTGRDIGSEIFPDAKLKFFLTASPEVRAERRFKQLKKVNPATTFEEVLRDTQKRDEADATREASPFRKPADAITVDTTTMTTEESVNKMLEEYERVFGE